MTGNDKRQNDNSSELMEREAERIRQEIKKNEINYHDDPDPLVLVDDTPGAEDNTFDTGLPR